MIDARPPEGPQREWHLATRRVKGGVTVAARLVYGRPIDPVTNEELDRSLRWWVSIDGGIPETPSVWLTRAEEIDKAEYEFLLADRDWAKKYAPDTPQANATKPVDLLTAPLPF